MQNIFHIHCQNIDTVTLPAASYSHSTRSSPFLMVSRRRPRPASVNSYFAPVLLIGLRCPVSFILPVAVRPGRAFPKDRKYHGNLGKCPYPTHRREVWKNLQNNVWAFSLCILTKAAAQRMSPQATQSQTTEWLLRQVRPRLVGSGNFLASQLLPRALGKSL